MNQTIRTLLVVMLSAIAAAVLGGYIGEAASKAHHVSEMEGGRGWLVLFCILFSFTAGAVIGILAKWRIKKFGIALLSALTVDSALATLAAAIAFLTVDSAPKIDGHKLTMEFEVKLPVGQTLPADSDNALRITVAGFLDQYNATLDLTRAAERDGRLVVPGAVPITSHNDHHELMVQMGRETEQDFVLNLPRDPSKQDEVWSEWLSPHYETASLPVAKERECAVRYRVQPR